MIPKQKTRLLSALIVALVTGLSLEACTDSSMSTDAVASIQQKSSALAKADQSSGDLIATVGNEIITFSQLNTMLNSSAMVGLSVPALGTPERTQVMITLLDKAISANLLYLDAFRKGTDKLPMYVNDVRNFEDAVLATLYRSKVLIGEIPVSEDEIQAYYKSSVKPDVELTDDVHLAIKAKVRDQKLKKLKDSMRERLRADVKVSINENLLDPDNGNTPADSDIIATIDDSDNIVWADVKALMRGADRRADNAAFYLDSLEERLKRLTRFIDERIMAMKARKVGLESDPVYLSRTREYRKTRLINIHRATLIHQWMPDDDTLKDYFVEHMDSIAVPEARKIQMVVVKTKQEAEEIKARIDKGEITMFQAAQQYSIDPAAKRTLGEMGWVSQGSGFDELDDFTFNLEPDTVSDPVQSPAGWHLIKVLDVRDAQMQDFDEPQTRRKTLRSYMKQKLDEYVINLRKNHFKVAVFDDVLHQRFQEEADMVAQLSAKAQKKDSVTEKRIEDLQKWIGKPPTF